MPVETVIPSAAAPLSEGVVGGGQSGGVKEGRREKIAPVRCAAVTQAMWQRVGVK